MIDPMTPGVVDPSNDSPRSDTQNGLAFSLRGEARRFGLTALLASASLIVLVFALAMTTSPENRSLIGVLALIVLTGLLGVGLSKILQGLAEVAGRLEEQAHRLDSLGKSLEEARLQVASASVAVATQALKPQRLAEIRLALRNAHWQDAENLVRMFEEGHPDDPETVRIIQELGEAQSRATQEILAKIKVAREINDPDRVIELRESLTPILKGDPLRDIDRDLARWFMLVIQKRLRSGTVGVDVAALAARIAGVLDETAEGASLRASLPTLRRAASLCPRCAQPYTGIADACPSCVAQALAHHNAAKSRGSGTMPAFQVPKQAQPTESVD